MTTDISTYRFNHTMIRVKDPEASLKFYQEILGMKLINKVDFAESKFTLYFLAYCHEQLPETREEKNKYIFSREAVLELTHNWGTQDDPNFQYHNGNKDPRGFGHIAISVDNIEAACARFEKCGVNFIKKLQDGKMNNIAFISDPDGYWVEIVACGVDVTCASKHE
ncbi:Lactoylglutathione lyase [Gigaspora margarita]|uniref:Lactoylglutathione lyase n=2 Tax=Gigaspora margarita TaxID=4874 RepID=A0A8H4AIP1_GIGMA|nr:Lactoylglutathione lyase [Gigaspora margarita]